MKLPSFLPQDQVFWYLNKHKVKPLTENIVTDVVIVGGGIAGLSAAQSFKKKGLKVALLEKNYCGSGASGKSSGFITPNSELSLTGLIKLHGAAEAKKLWEFAISGADLIHNNIKEFNLDCDYQVQDTLVLANSERAVTSDLKDEHEARLKLGYSSTLLSAHDTRALIGSNNYYGALTYGNSFGMHAYRYCQGMRHILQELGVHIYEETPVIDIHDHLVVTPAATVKAEHVIVCIDQFAHALPSLYDKVYHAQTFIMMSAPLSQTQIKKIFPEQQYMVWDTDLIYQYYRLSGDHRLMLGGARVLDTYASHETHNNTAMIKKLTNYFHTKFPNVPVQFEYIWPGLIGVSKDLLPIAGHDAKMTSVYYITAATGLPWAVALGNHSAQQIIDKDTRFTHDFSPYRSFPLGSITQSILGTRLTFALSHALSAF